MRRRKAELKSELGHAAVGVLGFRLTELKHVIGLIKLNYLKLGHSPLPIGVLVRETVGVLRTDRGSDIVSQPLCLTRGLSLSLSLMCATTNENQLTWQPCSGSSCMFIAYQN